VNVASYKNVDEVSLLQIPGVIYIPQVGKVTVAMLERNVMRLFDQFHHPNVMYDQQQHYRRLFNSSNHYLQNYAQYDENEENATSWYNTIMKHGTFVITIYTAAAITTLLAIQFKKSKS
jgi:hypothetical protein